MYRPTNQPASQPASQAPSFANQKAKRAAKQSKWSAPLCFRVPWLLSGNHRVWIVAECLDFVCLSALLECFAVACVACLLVLGMLLNCGFL